MFTNALKLKTHKEETGHGKPSRWYARKWSFKYTLPVNLLNATSFEGTISNICRCHLTSSISFPRKHLRSHAVTKTQQNENNETWWPTLAAPDVLSITCYATGLSSASGGNSILLMPEWRWECWTVRAAGPIYPQPHPRPKLQRPTVGHWKREAGLDMQSQSNTSGSLIETHSYTHICMHTPVTGPQSLQLVSHPVLVSMKSFMVYRSLLNHTGVVCRIGEYNEPWSVQSQENTVSVCSVYVQVTFLRVTTRLKH